MKTLRGRLVFAQILPWLLVAPLIGLTLYALLETQRIPHPSFDRIGTTGSPNCPAGRRAA